MLDQNVPNPVAKNPNFNTTKVFAAIGIILIVILIISGGIWYLVQSAEDKAVTIENTTVTKTATSSAKTATSSAKTATTSATKDETAGWKTYENTYNGKKFSFNYPQDWTVSKKIIDQAANNVDYDVTNGTFFVSFWNNRSRGSSISGPGDVLAQLYTRNSTKVTFLGEEQAAGESTAKDGKSWEIFPVSITTTFSYDLSSSEAVPTKEQRATMLLIVSTFKFL